MAVKSQPFGRVTLTEEDARAFDNRIGQERPSQAAKDAVRKGVDIARAVSEQGKYTFSMPAIPSEERD